MRFEESDDCSLLITQLCHNGALGIQQDLLSSVSKHRLSGRRPPSPADNEKPRFKRGRFGQYLISNITDAPSRFEPLHIDSIGSFLDEFSDKSFRTVLFLRERVVLELWNTLYGSAVLIEIFLRDDVQSDEGIIVRRCEIGCDFGDNSGPLVLIDRSKYCHTFSIKLKLQVDLFIYNIFSISLTALFRFVGHPIYSEDTVNVRIVVDNLTSGKNPGSKGYLVKCFHRVHRSDLRDTDLVSLELTRLDSSIVLALPKGTAAIFATFVIRELNSRIEIIARANEHENGSKLSRAGADYVCRSRQSADECSRRSFATRRSSPRGRN